MIVGMTADKQAELIQKACQECGLDGHVKWIKGKKDAQTWAEKIADRFRNKRNMPVKNSYMYCDQLDMSFFYTEWDLPMVTYAGFAGTNDKDIAEGQLEQAFRKAGEVLEAMRRLAVEEATQGRKSEVFQAKTTEEI